MEIKKLCMLLNLVFIFSITGCTNVNETINGVVANKTKESEKRSIDLYISAAASLTEAMDDIITLYTKENQEVNIILNLGSSGSLQRQIEQGAPTDVFLSAAKSKMTALKDEGLLMNDESTDLLKNEIVLIVPKNSGSINTFDDLITEKIKIFAMGEPESVPAGKYAQEVLKTLNMNDDLKDKSVFAKDVKEVLTWVELGEADAGMVYQTDALVSEQVKIVAKAPSESHTPIIYPAAVIKETKYPEEAKAFLEFLSSEEALDIFNTFGFYAYE